MHLPEGLSRYLRCSAGVALACVGLLFAGCGGSNEEEAAVGTGASVGEAAEADGLRTEEIPVRWASANANDLSALIAASQEVFAARVQRVTGEREEMLGAGGRGSPFPVTIYELQITRSFVGERAIGSLATFEQAGGITEQDGTRVRLMLEGDPAVEVGKEYLFFASQKENGTLSAPPYGRLEVTSDGTLEPLAVWAELGALQQLARVSADGVDSEINAASQ